LSVLLVLSSIILIIHRKNYSVKCQQLQRSIQYTFRTRNKKLIICLDLNLTSIQNISMRLNLHSHDDISRRLKKISNYDLFVLLIFR
jgi:16S rRNA A1518/A1519 N6-dimethyltransferase RsmA/KsgA/DIM1 with predicted DNA glycosylase/AP lyase activity